MNSQKRAWRAISLAATLAATISLAFLVDCSPTKLDGAAKRAVAAKAISPQVYAVIMPNNEDISGRWQEYQTSVSEIQKKTGYHFFKSAPVIESIAKAAGRF